MCVDDMMFILHFMSEYLPNESACSRRAKLARNPAGSTATGMMKSIGHLIDTRAQAPRPAGGFE